MRSPRRCWGATSASSTRVVGDTVNLAQRLQDLARPAGTVVLSGTTVDKLSDPPDLLSLPEQLVKGRETPVRAFSLPPEAGLVTESAGR